MSLEQRNSAVTLIQSQLSPGRWCVPGAAFAGLALFRSVGATRRAEEVLRL
jgi:hypothetical protein